MLAGEIPTGETGLPAGELRVSEKIAVGFFSYAVVACLLFPLAFRQRLAVFGLNLASIGVIFTLARFVRQDQTDFLSRVRDWLPCFLIFQAYRESGLFYFPDPTHYLDYLFVRLDARLLTNPWVLAMLRGGAPWLQRYLEFCYFLCYPLVPLGLGCIYLARRVPWLAGRNKSDVKTVDVFWTAVLLALFSCYALFPLFPSTPPRSFFNDLAGPNVQPLFRKMNFWILGQYGIHSSVFPSGHVAAVTATALSIRRHVPRGGWFFLIAAASVAVATVIGRYHYAADAAAGAAIGVAASWASAKIHHKA